MFVSVFVCKRVCEYLCACVLILKRAYMRKIGHQPKRHKKVSQLEPWFLTCMHAQMRHKWHSKNAPYKKAESKGEETSEEEEGRNEKGRRKKGREAREKEGRGGEKRGAEEERDRKTQSQPSWTGGP